MGAIIDAKQSVNAGVGVNLGRREARMTQQLLDMTHVNAAIEEMGGEGVANHMRVYVLTCGGSKHGLIEDSSDTPCGQPTAPLI